MRRLCSSSSGAPDGSPDSPDGAAGRPDGAATSDGDVPPPDASSCPGTGGPPGVRVGGMCIDRTEVTEKQYAAFLLAGPGASQPAVCAWNTTFGSAVASSDLPMVNVDWCDALAFCTWAGKKLCTRSQWRSACSTGSDNYPYGATYELGRCNDLNLAKGGRVAVASLSCAGAAGVHDMVGNVWEWIDECSGGLGALDPCAFSYGGGWGQLLSCDQTASGFVRSSSAGDVGFRCCSE